MRILYITQYFPPEFGAAAQRAFSITQCLAELGHKVQIISEIPNYPDGKIPDRYRKKLFYYEKFKGIDVIRTYVCASDRSSFIKKILFYLSFMISSFFGALRFSEFNLIIATSPPLPAAISGYFISRLKGAKLFLDIRDIWPDSIVVVGAMKERTMIYSILTKLERFLYRKARVITSPINGFKKKISQRTKTPFFHVPNIVNLVDFRYEPSEVVCQEIQHLSDKFIVLYAGNHGLAQGLEFILEAAREIEGFEDIIFLFVGEGIKKPWLEAQARNLNLNNVLFSGKRSHEEMPDIISLSDVCLVPLKKSDLFLNALPSKMFEFMALKKPVIVSIKGEAKELIEVANAGITIEPESSSELSKAILKLYKNRKLANKFGEKGYRYVEQFYSYTNQLEACSKVLKLLQ